VPKLQAVFEEQRSVMRLLALDSLFIIICTIASIIMTGCEVDSRSGVILSGTYSDDYGMGLDSASVKRLAEELHSGESVEVIVGSERMPLSPVHWGEVTQFGEGSFSLEVTDGSRTRFLGELLLSPGARPECPPSGQDAEPITTEAILSTSCSHNTYAWFCINCQCSDDGFHLRGLSQRYICIYGTWYSENVYACNCSFTARTCGEF
jgi:hypothetical protein